MSTKQAQDATSPQGEDARRSRSDRSCHPPALFLARNGKLPLNDQLMNMSFRRLVFVAGTVMIMAGCANKETKDALQKANGLEDQKQYQDANNVLLDALRARETRIRADAGTPADQAASDALAKRVQSDSEFLKLERAQIPIYLRLERADLASAVYADILAGSPGDSVVGDELHDNDPLIRTGAVRILGLSGKSEAIEPLAGATKDPSQEVRRAAVAALGTINDPGTVPPLIDALRDSYWFVRSEAANALGQEHDLRAVGPLLDSVRDSDKTVQSSSETALLFLCKDPKAPKDVFAARLNDPNPKLVLISAICLAVLKDPRAVPVLQKLVASPDATTRLDAVKALGETESPLAIPTLRQTLKDPDVNMQGWSIIGLGNLKDQGSLADLQAIADDNSKPLSIQSAAAAAVGKINGQIPVAK
jgi:HEAT repeat protein